MKKFKDSFFFLVKAAYNASFVIFCIWLLQLAYLPHLVYIPEYFKTHPRVAETVTEITHKEEMIQKIVKHSDPIPRGHFHITDEYIEKLIHKLETDPDLCLKCHGTYPHKLIKKTRSILNLHNGFMACEVCHVVKDPGDDSLSFVWINLETGKISLKSEGKYGKYPAKIVPIKTVNGLLERLDEKVGEKFSQEYLELKNKYKPGQLAEVKKIHEHHLSKQAVPCLDCHKKNGYLDLASLGFSKIRINHLSSSEIPRMLGKYDTFYMPKMLNICPKC